MLINIDSQQNKEIVFVQSKTKFRETLKMFWTLTKLFTRKIEKKFALGYFERNLSKSFNEKMSHNVKEKSKQKKIAEMNFTITILNFIWRLYSNGIFNRSFL